MEKPMTNNIKKVKDDLVAEIDKRIADKIIEKTNADLLKKLINQAESINEAIMIAELGTTYKRTGFHFDKRLEKMTDTIKYFKKNEKLSFVQDKKALTHKLIIGDNYDALLNLLIEYHGKIDVIYIDPPYGKDSMGEFAKTNYENAITRDNLLSMLYPRLVLARQLLSDNGVIFCSIDDKNQAYVKGLFDEVFWESNFVGSMAWESKTKSQNTTTAFNKLQPKIEYILLYSKAGRNRFNLISKGEKVYPHIDERGSYREHTLELMNAEGVRGRNSMIFDITDDVSTVSPPQGKQWKLGQDQVATYKGGGDLSIKNGKVVIKIRPENERNETTEPFWGFFSKEIGTAESAKKEVADVLGDNHGFETVKPVALIERLLFHTTDSNSVILDFFAGSGTTGHAVLELNRNNKGNRKFVLATNDENNIAQNITAKRLKRVMTGECYDGTKDFKWNEKNKPLGDNLDVYDIATVANFEATKDKTPFDLIDEILYGKEKLGVNEKIKWVCENFEGTQKTIKDK